MMALHFILSLFVLLLLLLLFVAHECVCDITPSERALCDPSPSCSLVSLSIPAKTKTRCSCIGTLIISSDPSTSTHGVVRVGNNATVADLVQLNIVGNFSATTLILDIGNAIGDSLIITIFKESQLGVLQVGGQLRYVSGSVVLTVDGHLENAAFNSGCFKTLEIATSFIIAGDGLIADLSVPFLRRIGTNGVTNADLALEISVNSIHHLGFDTLPSRQYCGIDRIACTRPKINIFGRLQIECTGECNIQLHSLDFVQCTSMLFSNITAAEKSDFTLDMRAHYSSVMLLSPLYFSIPQTATVTIEQATGIITVDNPLYPQDIISFDPNRPATIKFVFPPTGGVFYINETQPYSHCSGRGVLRKDHSGACDCFLTDFLAPFFINYGPCFPRLPRLNFYLSDETDAMLYRVQALSAVQVGPSPEDYVYVGNNIFLTPFKEDNGMFSWQLFYTNDDSTRTDLISQTPRTFRRFVPLQFTAINPTHLHTLPIYNNTHEYSILLGGSAICQGAAVVDLENGLGSTRPDALRLATIVRPPFYQGGDIFSTAFFPFDDPSSSSTAGSPPTPSSTTTRHVSTLPTSSSSSSSTPTSTPAPTTSSLILNSRLTPVSSAATIIIALFGSLVILVILVALVVKKRSTSTNHRNQQHQSGSNLGEFTIGSNTGSIIVLNDVGNGQQSRKRAKRNIGGVDVYVHSINQGESQPILKGGNPVIYEFLSSLARDDVNDFMLKYDELCNAIHLHDLGQDTATAKGSSPSTFSDMSSPTSPHHQQTPPPFQRNSPCHQIDAGMGEGNGWEADDAEDVEDAEEEAKAKRWDATQVQRSEKDAQSAHITEREDMSEVGWLESSPPDVTSFLMKLVAPVTDIDNAILETSMDRADQQVRFVDLRLEDDSTLLMRAIVLNAVECMPMLESLKPRLDVINKKRENILHLLCNEYCEDGTRDHVLENILEGNWDVVDVNAFDVHGFTPLMKAVRFGLEKIVITLMNHGADPCLICHADMSLETTEESNIMTIHDDFGVHPSSTTRDVPRGLSSLSAAVCYHQPMLLRIMLRAPFCKNLHESLDSDGRTILHHAVLFNASSCVHQLVRANQAMVHVRGGPHERTPFHDALRLDHKEVVSELLKVMFPDALLRALVTKDLDGEHPLQLVTHMDNATAFKISRLPNNEQRLNALRPYFQTCVCPQHSTAAVVVLGFCKKFNVLNESLSDTVGDTGTIESSDFTFSSNNSFLPSMSLCSFSPLEKDGVFPDVGVLDFLPSSTSKISGMLNSASTSAALLSGVQDSSTV
eukprot:m.117438 g.117438  ORF g.117438 m.117438 type:complete len:1281 (-) comp9323_c0_seq2:116-3958(-)